MGFCRFPAVAVDAHTALPRRIRRERGYRGPFGFRWYPFHHRQISFIDLPGFEELGKGFDRPVAFDKQDDTGGIGIEAVNEPEKLQGTGTSPEIAGRKGGEEGRCEVTTGVLPLGGSEHPAGGFIEHQDCAILIQDRDAQRRFGIAQFDEVRFHWA